VTAKMRVGDGPRAFGTFLRETCKFCLVGHRNRSALRQRDTLEIGKGHPFLASHKMCSLFRNPTAHVLPIFCCSYWTIGLVLFWP